MGGASNIFTFFYFLIAILRRLFLWKFSTWFCFRVVSIIRLIISFFLLSLIPVIDFNHIQVEMETSLVEALASCAE